MKAIILCAGKSTRMYPLTLTTPKPLIKILNKTLLVHILSAIKGTVNEAIIVVGYQKEMIIEAMGDRFEGIKLTYVEQKEQLGTGHAVLCAKNHIKKGERFLILPGDDIIPKKDIKNMVKHKFCVLTTEVKDPEKWGICVVDKNGYLIDIEEKPKKPKSSTASTALWVMDDRIFSLMEKQKKSERGEYEIVSALKDFIKEEKVFGQKVEGYWLPIGYPWRILIANEYLLSKIKKSEIKGKLSKAACVKGKIILGKGSEILAGVHIEGNVCIGENSKIGPNCYIRGFTTIGNNCRVGQAVELKNSVVGDNSKIPHLSYVGNSVIGNGCNLGAGTITANLRHNHGIVKTVVKDELIETGRKKFGAVLGDNVHTGINTSIYPGRKLWPNTTTKPGEIVDKDKTE